MNRRILAAAAAALALFFAADPARAAYSPATTNGWFTTAGRTTGGVTHTDLWLFNPDLTGLASVTLKFHPAVTSGASAGTTISSTVIILDARETKYLADVTAAVLPAGDGVFGAIEWQSDLPLLGLLRSVSASGGGTTGPIVPATPQSESMTPKTSSTDAVNVLQLVGLNSGDVNFSSRLDVANTSDVVLPIEVRVVELGSQFVGSVQSFSIAPRSLLRAGNILQAVGATAEDGLRITVGIAAGTNVPAGGIVAMATVTDSRSSDSFASLGQRQSSTAASGGPCTPDAQSLCLSNGRFKVQAAWETSTASGNGTAIPGTSDTGQFWFFSASNVEMVVKVLNACGLSPSRYWVFAGGLTNVKVTMTVTDMSNNTFKTYVNNLNTPFAPIQDTNAFATCP